MCAWYDQVHFGTIRPMSTLPDFSSSRVLVVGDVMLDRYWSGTTERISPEAPVPVVRVTDTTERPGGAANVALNLASLGSTAHLIGVVGPDEAGRRLTSLLQARGVGLDLIIDPSIRTITKLRVLSRHQQLVRLDFEETPERDLHPDWWPRFVAAGPRQHAVIVSDYGKRTLTRVHEVIAWARSHGKPVVVDPKGRDYTAYRGATLLTPNLGEFEAVVCATDSPQALIERGRSLREALGLEALLVTLGERGMLLIGAGETTLSLAAEAREVSDVTGAGDTVVATLAAALAAGTGLEEAARLANRAAGLVVAKLGAAQVEFRELEGAHRPHPDHPGIVTEAALVELAADFRKRGLCLVMTNGCFDLIHAGHVQYLTEARALGDALLVAVNSDESVRRLKGPRRPIVPLAQRMRVLAALEAVDWVVPFDEDTPERLICRVLPRILVKGGDYAPESIAGGDCVRRSGGRVAVLPYLEGVSTTGILEGLRG